MESLKKLKQWIVWRYENRPGEPKPAKVPYNPNVKHIKKENWQPVKNEKGFIVPEYSGGSMSNKSSTWGNYDAALKAMESGIFDGLGVMFANNLCGIDIDNCVEDGQLIGPAQSIINIMDSYTEYSPSGTGVHILFFGKIKTGKEFYKKNPLNGVEIYDKGRYFTFTGRTINDKNVEERTEQVEQVQLKYMLKEMKANALSNVDKSSGPVNISDSAVIKIASMANNGGKFLKLWNGDFSNYGSQSEADMALCNILSFYTGADERRIDSLFRQSGLYREKWEREDYRNNTIKAAVEATREVYNPNYKKSTAEDVFFDDNENIKLGVLEGPWGYIYRKIDGRTGEIIDVILSNFLISVIQMIKTDEDTFLDVSIGNNSYNTEKTINIKAFDNKSKFLDSISDMKFFFKAKEDQLQDIKYLVSKQPYRCLTGLSCSGIHTVGGKKLFATDTKVIDFNFNVQNDVIIPKEEVIIKSDILEVGELAADELKAISPYLFNFNTLEITSSILGTLPTFFLKPLWLDYGIHSKHLYIWGEAGSGKSETKRHIIVPFFNMENKSLDCNNLTQFSLTKYTQNSNVFPVILEEYKIWMMKQINIDLVSSCLRNTYDMSNAIRGTKDQTIKEYPQTTPMILVGESVQAESATKERGMIVSLSRMESRLPERTAAYEEFKKPKNKLAIQKLGKAVLNLILSIETEKIIEYRGKLKCSITDSRVKETALNAMTGICIIALVYEKLGLNFEKETGYKLSEVYAAIEKNAFKEILDGTHRSKSITDKTIELISNMKARNLLTEGTHFIYINNNTELALNVNRLFDDLTKYVRDFNVNDEIITNRNQFTKQLQQTEYFLARKAAQYTIYEEDFPAVWEKKKIIKSYVLSIEKLKESELDIDDLIP